MREITITDRVVNQSESVIEGTVTEVDIQSDVVTIEWDDGRTTTEPVEDVQVIDKKETI